MKTKNKRFLSLALSLLMVFSALSLFFPQVTAQADETYGKDSTFEFGMYPQTKVTDETLISALNACEGDWVNYGYYYGEGAGGYGLMVQGEYMKYKDVQYNGKKYRAVYFTAYRPKATIGALSTTSGFQLTNGYSINTVYWFEFEPLIWRVLDPSTGLVLCESVIDSQPFNNSIYYFNPTNDSDIKTKYYLDSEHTNYVNNYPLSSIRAWLNTDFYSLAFDAEDELSIYTTELTNKAYETKDYLPELAFFNYENTMDKVFLLSLADVSDTYGFPAREAYTDLRKRYATDYAKSQGVEVFPKKGGSSCWRLRTPSTPCYYATSCDENGMGSTGGSTYATSIGVCPALTINLKSLKCKHTYTAVVTPATCTAKGFTTHTCSKCSVSYVDTYTDALNHNIVTDAAVPVTCTTDGKMAGSHCTRCTEMTVAQVVIPALGHNCVDHNAITATCKEKGCKAYKTCTRCEYSTYEEIEKDSSNHVGGTQVRDAASVTCLKDGYTGDTYCLGCNAKLATGNTIPCAGSHTWGEWNAKNGTHTCTADGCGAVEACPHTDTAEGETCAICGYIVTATTEKLTFWQQMKLFFTGIMKSFLIIFLPAIVIYNG